VSVPVHRALPDAGPAEHMVQDMGLPVIFKNLLGIALRSILKNKLRSMLTSLGIIIGVSGVIVMSAVGEGTQDLIRKEINLLGTNVIIVSPGSSRLGGVQRGMGSLNRFTLDDVEKIKQSATQLRAISPLVMAGGQVIAGNANWATEICGVGTDYFKIKNWKPEQGTLFTEKDVNGRRKVALLGRTVADELFAGGNPVGQKVRIRNIPFTVIGVLEEKGQGGRGMDQDDLVIAPATTVLYRLKGGRYIDLITASAVSEDVLEDAEEEMRAALRDAHRLESGEDDFTIQNQTEIIELVTRSSKLMTSFLAAIAGIALIVGGIGIMNIMLVSVTERTHEIGIRMSVGACRGDIMVQFLTEAVVLSLIGGICGVLLALAAAWGINGFTAFSALIRAQMIFVSVMVSAAIGIIFGFFPARKAARLNPIDALRYE
jgi:putative ABC transport system permease protein